ncbi:MAG: CRISPR-associated endonuclease Cas1 [Candidatus Heimdallarchaeota archaeon]
MILIVAEHGAKIGKEGERLYVSYPKKELATNYVPIIKLEQLIIESKATLTSGAIDLLTANGIPTLFFRGGKPVGILHSYVAHGTVAIRRAQILAYETEMGTAFAIDSIKGAIANKRNLLRRIQKNRQLETKQEEVLKEKINELNKHLQKDLSGLLNIPVRNIRDSLFAFEGAAADAYFTALKELIPPNFNFRNRNRRPPKDPINSLLSYGYSVLTNKVLSGVLIAGLEPYAGFLHADRSGKPSLVLDLIEEFRQPIVDRLILRLVGKNEVSPDNFELKGEFCKIKDDLRKHYLTELVGMFTQKETNAKNGKSLTFEQHIIYQARYAGKYFKGEKEDYVPFALAR